MYKLQGKVIKGDGYGRTLGFPTANLDRRDFLRLEKKPKFGVWSGTAILNKKVYKSAIVIGPLDKNGLPKVEAHLIGFSGNIYGAKIEIEIHKFLRQFKKYKNIDLLKEQIKKDLKQCR